MCVVKDTQMCVVKDTQMCVVKYTQMCVFRYSAKETYTLIDPADRSHPIIMYVCVFHDTHLCVLCVVKYTYTHYYGVATVSRIN